MRPNPLLNMPISYLIIRLLRVIQSGIVLTISIVLLTTLLFILLGGIVTGFYYLYIHYGQYLPKIGG